MPRHVHLFTPEERRRAVAARHRLSPETHGLLLDLGLKYCWACEGWKTRDRFNRNRARTDGLDPTCRSCRQRQRKERAA